MKLLFKQRLFSWLDSYDIYDENDETVYTVQGQLSWGHKLVIKDTNGFEIGMVKEEVLTFLPRFTISLEGQEIGKIEKELSFFKPKFHIDCLGWQVEGDFFEWDYAIHDESGKTIAAIYKEVFSWTDTYVLDIENEKDAIYVLMMVLAIDAAKCSNNGSYLSQNNL